MVFSFLSSQRDSIYLRCADHNSLTHTRLLGKKKLRLQLAGQTALGAHILPLFVIPEAPFGSEMPQSKNSNTSNSAWVNSLILKSNFHYLCLNFMLFKLFMQTEGCSELFITLLWILLPLWVVKIGMMSLQILRDVTYLLHSLWTLWIGCLQNNQSLLPLPWEA